MEKTPIRSASLCTERGRQLNLTYYLLTRPGDGFDSYGVEVRMQSNDGETAAALPDITPVGSEILAMIDRLADGTVTPSALAEIMQELLG